MRTSDRIMEHVSPAGIAAGLDRRSPPRNFQFTNALGQAEGHVTVAVGPASHLLARLTMNYPHDVPSIAQMHTGFAGHPTVQNNPALQGILASKIAGSPIDPLAVPDAEHTLGVLVGLRGEISSI